MLGYGDSSSPEAQRLRHIEVTLDERLVERTNNIRTGILKRDEEIALLRKRLEHQTLLTQRAERLAEDRKQAMSVAVEKANRVISACRGEMHEMDARLSRTLAALARAKEAPNAKGVFTDLGWWFSMQIDALRVVVDAIQGRRSNPALRRRFKAAVWAVIFCRAHRPGKRQVWTPQLATESLRSARAQSARALKWIAETEAAANALPDVARRANEAEEGLEQAAQIVRWLEARLEAQVAKVDWAAQGLGL